MAFDLGDQVPLGITVTNSDGDPQDAGQITVTITLPDGTTETSGPIASASAGQYNYDYPTVQAGRHLARWVATGTNSSSYRDAFDVEPADGAAFISLVDAKNHVRLTGSEDDESLRWFVDTACQVITDRMGAVSPTTVVADRPARGGTIVLSTRPVISITSVERLPGLAAVPAADRAAGTDGWVLESVEGVLSVPSSRGLLRVTYRAGRSPLPPNFRLAALELIAHLWQGSQHNGGGGRPSLSADAIATSVRPYALPYRVMELLGLRKDQERDEIFVG